MHSWRIVPTLALSTLLCGCGDPGARFLSNTKKEEPALRVAMIPMATAEVFWKSVYVGALEAQRDLTKPDLRLDLLWRGPLKDNESDYQRLVIDDFAARRVEGLIIAPVDTDSIQTSQQRASQAGIPVVLLSLNAQALPGLPTVTPDYAQGGLLAAEFLAARLTNQGTLLIVREPDPTPAITRSEQALLSQLSPKLTNVVSLDLGVRTSTGSESVRCEDLLRELDTNIHGIYAGTRRASQVVNLATRASPPRTHLTVVASGLDPELTQALRDERIQALIAVDGEKLGYRALQLMADRLAGRTVATNQTTPMIRVTTNNLADPMIQRLLQPPLADFFPRPAADTNATENP